ncbi:MAG: glutathione S-transferase [Gammaproteobacteria bacterium]|nr:MAG: glutathione S-transferase [Gammaproteobacteria bacterium]
MITLHYLENSRAQRILWLLEELEVEYEVKHYKRDSVTNLAPKELKEIHPLGKSPVITDGDRVVAESAVITDYLIDKFGQGKLKPAYESNDYWKYQDKMHYAEGTIMSFLILSMLFNKIKETPVPFFIKPIVKAIANKPMESYVTPNINSNLDYLNEELADTGWFAGKEMTGADFMMSFPLEAMTSKADLSKSHPNIVKFVNKIHALPSYKRALEKGLPYQFS